jgi:regulator of sigma E protease
VKTFVVSVKSLALLFRGIDLTQAVSGPARITYMVGEIATQGFGQSFETGLSSAGSFLALISIALCFMNLLPLPILDGGLIVLSVVEGIKGGPLNPKFVSMFQTAGVVIVFSLMVFSVFNDILFFANR